MAEVLAGTVRVEVFSDIACPWCYIGESRLSRAMERTPEIEVEWSWRPYQLQPGLPPEGLEWESFARAKFGGESGAARAFAHVAAAGASDGLEFRFDRITRAPNTALAHQAILWAERYGLGRQMAAGLFRAHFSEGRDVGGREALLEVGEAVGLDRDDLNEYLATGEGAAAVVESQNEAMRLGITGVPFYIFDRALAISGAQAPELFESALRQAAGRRSE